MHHGKNLQDHGKNLQIGLFGTHQISIPSANFCLTPPRKIQDFFTDIPQYIVSVEIPQNSTFRKI